MTSLNGGEAQCSLCCCDTLSYPSGPGKLSTGSLDLCSRFVPVFGLEQRGWCFQNTVEQKVLNAEFVVCCMVGSVELIVD